MHMGLWPKMQEWMQMPDSKHSGIRHSHQVLSGQRSKGLVSSGLGSAGTPWLQMEARSIPGNGYIWRREGQTRNPETGSWRSLVRLLREFLHGR